MGLGPVQSDSTQVRQRGDDLRRSVLYVHGQPGLGKDFDGVARLLESDHTILAPDRPGYGSSAREALSISVNAEVLARLIESKAAAPATVVGHSYGGAVAILLAARRPELVRGLVLAASVGRADSLKALDHVLATPVIGEALSAAGLVALGRVLPRLRGIASVVPHGRAEQLRASLPDSSYLEVASGRGRRVWKSFVFEQRALIDEIEEVERALPTIESPAVVITGSWDIVIPPSVARSIADMLPNAEVATVDRVGHFLPRDAPEVIASAVRAVEGRPGGGLAWS